MKKLTKEQQKDLLWMEYENFSDEFSDLIKDSEPKLEAFLLYKILKENETKNI